MYQVCLNARRKVYRVFLKGRLKVAVRRYLSMQQSCVVSVSSSVWSEVLRSKVKLRLARLAAEQEEAKLLETSERVRKEALERTEKVQLEADQRVAKAMEDSMRIQLEAEKAQREAKELAAKAQAQAIRAQKEAEELAA